MYEILHGQPAASRAGRPPAFPRRLPGGSPETVPVAPRRPPWMGPGIPGLGLWMQPAAPPLAVTRGVDTHTLRLIVCVEMQMLKNL